MSESNPLPPFTYELILRFEGEDHPHFLKQQVVGWLLSENIAFAESSFLKEPEHEDFDEKSLNETFQEELEGASDTHPISIYAYDQEQHQNMQKRLIKRFENRIQLSQKTIPTLGWREGWKDSFKPFFTKKFFIYPPWESPDAGSGKHIPLCIEPGMAFGTGQHATTRACLKLFEDLWDAGELVGAQRVLDVGTGTGILAIAASKMGIREVLGTDTDGFAIKAAEENVRRNLGEGSSLSLLEGSLPPQDPATDQGAAYDLVFCNILLNVLMGLIPRTRPFISNKSLFILSGFLESDIPELTSWALEQGFDLKATVVDSGWAAAALGVS